MVVIGENDENIRLTRMTEIKSQVK